MPFPPFSPSTDANPNPNAERPPELSALIRHLQSIARQTRMAQAQLSVLLGGESVVEPSFTEVAAPTPDEVAAAFANQPEAQSYWVVLRGREPGLYLTVQAADAQTNGVPHNKKEKKTGLAAALSYYRSNFPEEVKKLVELPAEWVDVPRAVGVPRAAAE